MKKLLIILLSISFGHGIICGKNNLKGEANNKHEVFCDYLEKSLNKIKQAENAEEIYSFVNEIDRLGNLYPNEWLANYYVAYLDLKLVFISNEEQQNKLLEEAKNKIDILRQDKNADLSEIFTLEGYYYYGLIAQDPSVNGQKYYKEVIMSYNKAIGVNSKNPRPVLLLSIFKNKMSKFMGGGDSSSFCQELLDIEKMFFAFKPQEKLYPDWGMEELNSAREKACAQSENSK